MVCLDFRRVAPVTVISDPSSALFLVFAPREGLNERSSSSLSQSDTVPETNRYALPTS